MASSTEVRLLKRFPDGQTGDVAVGNINTFGIITIDRIAPGQEASVSQIVRELNASDIAYKKEIAVLASEPENEFAEVDPDAPLGSDNVTAHSALVKRGFERGSAGFFSALVATTERFYGLELRFDADTLILAISESAAKAAAVADETAAAAAAILEAEDAALEARIAEAKAASAALEEAEDEVSEDNETIE